MFFNCHIHNLSNNDAPNRFHPMTLFPIYQTIADCQAIPTILKNLVWEAILDCLFKSRTTSYHGLPQMVLIEFGSGIRSPNPSMGTTNLRLVPRLFYDQTNDHHSLAEPACLRM